MPSKNTGSQLSTEKVSPGSKNTFKGLWAEEVVKQHFINRQFKLLDQRKKLKYGEVDLIFEKNKKIYLIEVKFLHSPWMSFERLGHRQKQRLHFNVINEVGFGEYDVVGLLCFVDKNKKVSVVEVFS